MRLRAWTLRIGPVFLAAALVPTLVGAVLLAAPAPRVEPVGQLGVDSATEVSAASKDRVTPRLEQSPSEPPPLECTPLRGTSHASLEPPAVAVRAVLTTDGEQVGRRVSVRARRGAEVTVRLPAESFVASPSGDWVVYGATGSSGSEVRALDLETGCDVRLARLDGVARGAILDARGTYLYVHAVEAQTRSDLGVVRIDLTTGATHAALPRFRPPQGFGPIYSTSLSWSMERDSLAVQSCGSEDCQTRLLDVATGEVQTFDVPHGGLVGVTKDVIVAFASGHERPAALLAISRVAGTPVTLVDEAYEAQLIGTPDAPVIRVDTPGGWQEVAP